MDTLLKSFDSFSEKHGNSSFFVAHPHAGDFLSQLTPKVSRLPLHLSGSLERAQNFLPHEHAVEFILSPEARIADVQSFPRSLNGIWDLTHDEDESDPLNAPVMPKSQLVGDNLLDGIWHAFSDTLEVHNPNVLIPVGIHPPIQIHSDAEAIPIQGEIDSQHDTVVIPECDDCKCDKAPCKKCMRKKKKVFEEAFELTLGENDFMDLFAPGTDYGQRPAVSTVSAEDPGLRDVAEYPMFKRDQPAIGAFAQANADNMARLLIFVVASIKVAWPLMQYYFPIMFDVLKTKGTVQYPDQDKPVWTPLVIGKVKTIDYLWANRSRLYTGLMRAVEADNKAGNTGFLVYKQMILVPGLGVPKAGFATQLLIGKYGCIDSVNLNLLNAKAPTHLMTKAGTAFKPASQISIPDSGREALTSDEFRSLITSETLTDDQKHLVTFLYGALTKKSLEVLQGYVDYLKALESEGTGTEELWNIWCTVIAHKIHHGGGKKRPIDVVLPNQTKPSRVQAYAAIPKELLAKSQASIKKDGKFNSVHGGDVVSADHRRLIRGESVIKARPKKK